jgi:magnesium chelatase subunit D
MTLNGDGEAAPERSLWEEAVMAASLFAVDPVGLGGIVVCSQYGPVRDQWVEYFRSILPDHVPFRKLPLYAADERLFGGLDLAATLAHGKPIAERGLLADMDGGYLIVPSCERMEPGLASRLGIVMDMGAVHVEREATSLTHPARFGVIALDESEGSDERPPVALLERLGLRIDLTELGYRDVTLATTSEDEIAAARARLPEVEVPDKIVAGLCAAASAFGVYSLRAPIFAVRVARAAAALAGRTEATDEDAGLAALFVIAPRATRTPAPPPEEPPPPEEQEKDEEKDKDQDSEEQKAAEEDKPLTDMIIAAAEAAIPKHVLSSQAGKPIRVPPSAPAGKSGSERTNAMRGRPAGTRRGEPRPGSPMSLIETLRAAAPWQKIRRAFVNAHHRVEEQGVIRALEKIEVRSDDFRVKRLKARSQTATIFAVDASGSTAMQRLAETKGAIELLLAECYIRRDQVALIAFRGKGAEMLLPPTRSLTRAKRSLAALPGGGGTPLASGIAAATALAINVRRRGIFPLVVIMTDGKGNIAADGKPGRERAQIDASTAAKRLRAEGIATMLVDTSPRPQPQAERLAQQMAARYLPLPYANAAAISNAARMAAKA